LPGMRKGENTPLSLPEIMLTLQGIRGESATFVAESLFANVSRLFGLNAQGK